jgi:tyrosine-protein kinase Etk/Wzc
LPRKSIDLAKLQRARLSTEKLYTLVDEKYNEAAITEKSEFGSVNIIDRATVPLKPISPKVLLNLLLGLVLGLGTGLAIVYTRQALDTKVRAPGDIKRMGLPTLTVISRIAFNGRGKYRDGKRTAQAKGMDRHLIAHTHGTSAVVESYRHLLTSLKNTQMDKPLQSVMVTSVKMGEGKSITISNLAIVAAESDRRVLLVDADLRRPTIHTIFGKPKEPGVMNVVNGGGLPGVIYGEVLPNLHIMCSGIPPPNPSAVISSIKMRDLLTDLNRDFDLVLVDSPPIFAVNDALILATMVDGIILVASAGETTRTELEEGIEAFGEMRTKLLGVVLNNFDMRKALKAVPGGYGYGYGRYGTGYY